MHLASNTCTFFTRFFFPDINCNLFHFSVLGGDFSSLIRVFPSLRMNSLSRPWSSLLLSFPWVLILSQVFLRLVFHPCILDCLLPPPFLLFLFFPFAVKCSLKDIKIHCLLYHGVNFLLSLDFLLLDDKVSHTFFSLTGLPFMLPLQVVLFLLSWFICPGVEKWMDVS